MTTWLTRGLPVIKNSHKSLQSAQCLRKSAIGISVDNHFFGLIDSHAAVKSRVKRRSEIHQYTTPPRDDLSAMYGAVWCRYCRAYTLIT